MPAGAAPQSMKIFPLLKGDSALGEGARGMSNRPEQGHPPGGCATTPLKGGFFVGAAACLNPSLSLGL